VVVYDSLGGGVEITSARVVAETLPGVEDVRFCRGSERGEIREALEPTAVVGDHRRDLCLLQHQLRDEHRVRIARVTPWKIAAMLAIPGNDTAAERGLVEIET
jgi:hypothetical protein